MQMGENRERKQIQRMREKMLLTDTERKIQNECKLIESERKQRNK